MGENQSVISESVPWLVQEIDEQTLARIASIHQPHPAAVALGVDIICDPHTQDDEGYNWTRLRFARDVNDVIPGSAVVMGGSIGSYLAKVVSWDFEVSDDDPRVVLARIPLDIEAVSRAITRYRRRR